MKVHREIHGDDFPRLLIQRLTLYNIVSMRTYIELFLFFQLVTKVNVHKILPWRI